MIEMQLFKVILSDKSVEYGLFWKPPTNFCDKKVAKTEFIQSVCGNSLGEVSENGRKIIDSIRGV